MIKLPKNKTKILLYLTIVVTLLAVSYFIFSGYFGTEEPIGQFPISPEQDIYVTTNGGPYVGWSDPISNASVVCTYVNVDGKGYGDYCWTTNGDGTVANNGYGYTLRELWKDQVSPSANGRYPWTDGGPHYAWENEDTKSVYVCNGEYCWLWNAQNKTFSNNGRPVTINPGTQSNGTQPTQILNPDFSKLNNSSKKPWGQGVVLTSAWRDPVNNFTYICDRSRCFIYSDSQNNWLSFTQNGVTNNYFDISKDSSFWKTGLWVSNPRGGGDGLVESIIYQKGPNAALTSYSNNQTLLIGERYLSDDQTRSFVWSYQNSTSPSWVKDGSSAPNTSTFFPQSKYKKYLPRVSVLMDTRIRTNSNNEVRTINSANTTYTFQATISPETLGYFKPGDKVKFEIFNSNNVYQATVGTVTLQQAPTVGLVNLQKQLSQIFGPETPVPQGNFKLKATYISLDTGYSESFIEYAFSIDLSPPEPNIAVKDTSVSANVITNTKASPITACAAGKWCSWPRNDNSQSYVGPNGVLSLKTKTNGSKDYGSCWIQFLGTSTNPIKADGSTYRLKADIIKSNSAKPYPSGKAFFQFEVNGNSNLVPGGISATRDRGVDRVITLNDASKPLSLKFCTYGTGDVDDTISVSKLSFVKLTKLDRPVIWTGQNATVQQGTKITISMGNPQSNTGVTIKYCYRASSLSRQCTPSQVVPSDGVALPVGTWVVRAMATKTGFADSDVVSNTINVTASNNNNQVINCDGNASFTTNDMLQAFIKYSKLDTVGSTSCPNEQGYVTILNLVQIFKALQSQ